MVSCCLQERNRKLNTEVTRLKNQAVEQQSDIQQLQQQLHKARTQQQEQHGLIKQLETDLMLRWTLSACCSGNSELSGLHSRAASGYR